MTSAVDMMNTDGAPSAARSRRERRLRQFLRHERLTVAMVLSDKKHHTSRGQRKDRSREEEYATHYTAKFPKTPSPQAAATVYHPLTDDEGGELAAGVRPVPLAEGEAAGEGGAARRHRV